MKAIGLFLIACAALALSACGTLDPNVTLAQGSVIGLGAKGNPDGTGEAAIGYLGASYALVPSVDAQGHPITIAGHCAENRELATLISVSGNANNAASAASGITLNLNVGTLVATGQPAINVSDALKYGASKGAVNPPSYEDAACAMAPAAKAAQ